MKTFELAGQHRECASNGRTYGQTVTMRYGTTESDPNRDLPIVGSVNVCTVSMVRSQVGSGRRLGRGRAGLISAGETRGRLGGRTTGRRMPKSRYTRDPVTFGTTATGAIAAPYAAKGYCDHREPPRVRNDKGGRKSSTAATAVDDNERASAADTYRSLSGRVTAVAALFRPERASRVTSFDYVYPTPTGTTCTSSATDYNFRSPVADWCPMRDWSR